MENYADCRKCLQQIKAGTSEATVKKYVNFTVLEGYYKAVLIPDGSEVRQDTDEVKRVLEAIERAPKKSSGGGE